MGLRAKFNLMTLVAFCVGFLVAAIILDLVAAKTARHEVLQNARIMMTAANGVRGYTVQDLVPLLPIELGGKFVPETVPAFAAQTTFKNTQTAFPGYAYREPTLNPTNPMDRAQDWEADIIRLFRDDPNRQEVVLERATLSGPMLNLAQPIAISDEACLTCHSAPSAAPAALTHTYGTTNGFGWKLKEIIGAQLVSVPIAVPLKLAHRLYIMCLIALVGVFAIVLVVMNLLLHYLVIAPVKRLSAMAEAVSLGEEHIEPYVKPGKDEISLLSVAFNRMRESLKRALAMIG